MISPALNRPSLSKVIIMQVPVELKMRYLNRRSQDIQELRHSIEQNDYSLAVRLGHQVKGNAVTFDFPQMAFIGVDLENAAKRKDKEKIKILIQKMEMAIQSAWSEFPGSKLS